MSPRHALECLAERTGRRHHYCQVATPPTPDLDCYPSTACQQRDMFVLRELIT
jgi:hypothetical protein